MPFLSGCQRYFSSAVPKSERRPSLPVAIGALAGAGLAEILPGRELALIIAATVLQLPAAMQHQDRKSTSQMSTGTIEA
jgi:hypothetical protein